MSVEPFERIEIKLLRDIRDLLRRLFRHRAESARLVFVNSKGEEFMDVTVHINDTPLRAFLAEFLGPNATGTQIAGIGPTTYTSSDPTVATVDPVTGNLVYIKQGQTTIVGLNAGNQLTSSGVLTIISGVAQSSDLQFLAQLPAAAPAAASAAK